MKFTIDFNGSFGHLCGEITHLLAGESRLKISQMSQGIDLLQTTYVKSLNGWS